MFDVIFVARNETDLLYHGWSSFHFLIRVIRKIRGSMRIASLAERGDVRTEVPA
jgi:hypothetical protein